jgi:hypothetical protein
MKVKLVLLLIAAVGSTALVASAQQESYVIRSDDLGSPRQDTPKDAVIRPVPPVMRQPGALPTNSYYSVYGAGHPTVWTLSGEEAGLSHQAEQLAQQLASAKSDSDRDKIKSQLTETLEKQFDQRQKRHEQEIKALEAQVKKLRDLVEKRQENRREIISSRLNQILKESQGLGW